MVNQSCDKQVVLSKQQKKQKEHHSVPRPVGIEGRGGGGGKRFQVSIRLREKERERWKREPRMIGRRKKKRRTKLHRQRPDGV